MMLVETGVFSGDDGVLEVGGDLAEGNELVVFVVGLAMNPGLHAALDLDGGGGRVDPSSGDEGEGGEGPEKEEAEGQPAENGSEGRAASGAGRTLPRRGPGVCVWHGVPFEHNRRGGLPLAVAGRRLAGKRWQESRVRLRHLEVGEISCEFTWARVHLVELRVIGAAQRTVVGRNV